MGVDQFRFFDKKGNRLQGKFNRIKKYHEFNLYFDRVSTNLFEVEQVYLFEEILKQADYNSNLTSQSNPIDYSQDKLINLLGYLISNDLNESSRTLEKIAASTVFNLTPEVNYNEDALANTLGIDKEQFYSLDRNYNVAKEFLDQHKNYIYRNYNYSVGVSNTTYKISEEGINYYNEFKENLDKRQNSLSNQLVSEYVKPISNFENYENENSPFIFNGKRYSGKDIKNELVYLYFNWKKANDSSNSEDKIFPFLINQENVTEYIRDGKKQTCLSDKESFPEFVPLYDRYLLLDDQVNPSWRDIFPTFSLQKSKHLAVDQNATNQSIRKYLKPNPANYSSGELDPAYIEYKKEFSGLDKEPLQLNFAVSAEDADVYQRKLELFVIKRNAKNEAVFNILKIIEKDGTSTTNFDFINSLSIVDKLHVQEHINNNLTDPVIVLYEKETGEKIEAVRITAYETIAEDLSVYYVDENGETINPSIFTGILEIERDWVYFSNYYKIAEFNFQAEVIEEDEGFKTILENFGRVIDTDDMYVLENMDIDEDLPDWLKINEKRKELILLSEEIYQYFGSYRSFKAAMEWLGYQDIRLKEYFYNIKKTKPKEHKIYYSSVEIPTEYTFKSGENFNIQKYGNIIKDPDWRKTSRFGLVFDLMSFSGEYDDDGFPIYEFNQEFTPEEISVKLYGIRNFLHKYFLPHHVRIVDITAEGIYFTKYNLSVWNDQTPIIRLNFGNDLDFNAYPRQGELKNLNKFINEYDRVEGTTYSKSLGEIAATGESLSKYKDNVLGIFSDNYMLNFPYDNELQFDLIKPIIPTSMIAKNRIVDFLFNSNVCSERSFEDLLLFQPDWTTVINKKLQGHIVRIDGFFPDVLWSELTVTGQEIQPYLMEDPITKLGQFENPVLGPVRDTEFDLVTSSNIEYSEARIPIIHQKKLTRWVLDIPTDLATEDNNRLLATLDVLEQEGVDLENKLNYTDSPESYFAFNTMYPAAHTASDPRDIVTNDATWLIKHSDPNVDFCYKLSGTFSDIKSIIVFLPHQGFYDVKLTIYNRSNFPIIVYKEKHIEVTVPNIDILAIGQFVTGNDNNQTLETVQTCPIVSKISELSLSSNDLDYANYIKQDFCNLGNKKSNVLFVDDKTVTIEGNSFYKDRNEFGNKWRRDVLVFARDSKDVYSAEYVKVLARPSHNTFDVQMSYTPKISEKISLYEDLIYTNFTIDSVGKFIMLKIDNGNFNIFPDSIIPGIVIFLYEENYNREKKFIIKDIEKNYVENYIKIWINDDGSLAFLPVQDEYNLESVDEFGHPYHRSNWKIFRIKDKIIESRITNIEYITAYTEELSGMSVGFIKDYPNNSIVRITISNEYNLRLLEPEKLANLKYRMDFGLHSGWFVKTLSEYTTNGTKIEYIELDENGNTIVTYQNDEELRKIDTNWKIIWNPNFDLDLAKRSTTSNNLDLSIYGDFKLGDMYHLNSNLLDYRSDPILGFEIFGIENLDSSYLRNGELETTKPGAITANGTRYDIVLGRFPYEEYQSIRQTDDIHEVYATEIRVWKYQEVTKYLNSIQEGPLSYYEFYNDIENNKIIAVAKFQSQLALIKLEYENISGSKSSYLMSPWQDFERYFFDGPNNKATWNRFSLGYDDFETETNLEETEINFRPQSVGSFAIGETFIKSEDFAIPVATTVFFIYPDETLVNDLAEYQTVYNLDNYEFNSVQDETNPGYPNGEIVLEDQIYNKIRLSWELIDEINNVTLLKTVSRNILWLFREPGKYSIKLKIETPFYSKEIEKKTFVTVY